MFRSLRIAVVATALSAVVAAAPPLTVDIKQTLTQAGRDVRARVIVEPDPANRTVCLHGDLKGFPDLYKSCWNADGPRSTWKTMKKLEAGAWEVYASVERNDNTTRYSSKVRVTVMGLGFEDDGDDPFGAPPF